MWGKAGTRAPDRCRKCRSEARLGMTSQQFANFVRRGRVPAMSRSDQLRQMHEAAHTPRLVSCPCGLQFMGVGSRVYCDQCRADRRKDHYRRKNVHRQARAAGFRDVETGELVTIATIGDRDDWSCGRCLLPVDRSLAYPDPMMPSFGHIVPISKGGPDTASNLRVEHLSCNVKAGNR